MIKEALQYLVDKGAALATSEAVLIEKEWDGRKYINKELKPVNVPLVAALGISTLGSLIDLCRGKWGAGTKMEGFEKFDPKHHVIHVVNEKQVQVVSAVSNAWKHREILVDCKLTETNSFIFNKFVSQDDFIIGLLSSFAESDDKGPLAKIAGNATAEQVVTLVDDGVTQSVSTRAGAFMQDSQAVKGLVRLAPWRTFRDVAQPASNFLFRVKKNGDVPQFALFEADGGAWKLEALEGIARKLSAGLTEATVVS
jgi:hypothetical protein